MLKLINQTTRLILFLTIPIIILVIYPFLPNPTLHACSSLDRGAAVVAAVPEAAAAEVAEP